MVEPTLNRSCEPCRSLKVRCLPGDAAPPAKCQRCLKSNRECVFKTATRRKQRKRTDTRVGELEHEIRIMRSLISQHHEVVDKDNVEAWSTASKRQHDGKSDQSTESSFASPGEHLWATPGHTPASPTQVSSNPDLTPNYSCSQDVIGRRLLTMDAAEKLFESYCTELAYHMPIVIFSPHTTAADIRRRKPILFVAVLAAAASKSRPDLWRVLNDVVRQAYAQKVVMQGEKTLELVQAILITAIWYYPPDDFKDLNFYQYIHMAATMALDLGMGRAPSSDLQRKAQTDHPVVDSGHIESRRTLLGCYLMCAR